MQLAILIAVIASIASSEAGSAPLADIAWRLFVVASASLLAPLAALAGSQRLATTLDGHDDGDDAIARLEKKVVVLWLAAVVVMLVVAQWPRIVRSNWNLAGWPLVDELAILLPVIAPLVLVWAALYRSASPAAYCRASDGLLRHVWLQVRHQLGLVLVPPLAVVGVYESISTPTWGPADLDVGLWFMFPLMAMAFVLLPVAVRRMWRTTPLAAGRLRDRLEETCRERRCHVREILIWDTGGTMANAAVVGISRLLRYVLLTDVLVERLNNEQLAAVLRHELAHLRRWHLPLRMAVLLLPVVGWLAIKNVWPEAESMVESWCVAAGVRPELVAVFGIPLGLLTYVVLVLGWFSRLLEHDADIDAVLGADSKFCPLAARDFCSALAAVCGPGGESWLNQWLHPPVHQRLGMLRRLADAPSLATRLRLRLRILTIAVAVCFFAALLVGWM
jgi:Zn-dependent protease with chaperone function